MARTEESAAANVLDPTHIPEAAEVVTTFATESAISEGPFRQITKSIPEAHLSGAPSDALIDIEGVNLRSSAGKILIDSRTARVVETKIEIFPQPLHLKAAESSAYGTNGIFPHQASREVRVRCIEDVYAWEQETSGRQTWLQRGLVQAGKGRVLNGLCY